MNKTPHPIYPEIKPYHSGRLKVSEIHELYFEEYGNKDGKPAVYLHGGPGGTLNPYFAQFFNPEKYRIIQFDQRGCGKSTPHAELAENTSLDLVSDIECLRKHLQIERWLVCGGSWGSTLSLLYGIHHPERVTELVLRGIFLLRKKEIDWLFEGGCGRIFPEAWEGFLSVLTADEKNNILPSYYKKLTHSDKRVRKTAAKAWATWEASVSRLVPDPELIEHFADDTFSDAIARIECHYMLNHFFLEDENFILNQASKLNEIPTLIIQGRYDVVCPYESAWELHKRLPHSELICIDDAGHSVTEPGIAFAIREATDLFSR